MAKVDLKFTCRAQPIAQRRGPDRLRAFDMPEQKKHQPPGTSGYPEPQPTPSKKHQHMPDAKTPHEPQNNPRKKPTRQSS